jgi:hypothetical protein
MVEAGSMALVNPDVGNNLCLPLAMTPSLRRRRRGSMRRRHYLSETRDGCLRIYLGVANHAPVLEYLHRLVLLAFGAEQPHDPHGQGAHREACHCCCHPWCGNANHMMWASHAVNQAMLPAVEGNV